MRFSTLSLLAISVLATGPAVSQIPEPAPAPSGVKLTLDVGLVSAAGNTDVTTLNVGNTFEAKGTKAGFAQFSNVVYGKAGDSTNAEQLKAGIRIDRQIVSVVHGFVGVTYERNRFAGLGRRFEEFAGLAFRVLDLPTDLWTFDVGSSINQQRSVTDVERNFVGLRLATLYRHNFSKTAFLSLGAEALPNMENTDDLLVNSESSLVAPLSGRIALKISYIVKFDNLPEPGFEKTDRILSSGLQISL